jgi:C1A family cysteine protease
MNIYKYLLKKSSFDIRDLKYENVLDNLPSRINLCTNIPDALNQGKLASCALNATSNFLKYLLIKEDLPVFQPSRLFLYYNTRVHIENSSQYDDTGVALRSVCKALKKYHVCDEEICPYDIAKFSETPSSIAYENSNLHQSVLYKSVPQNLSYIKSVLASGYLLLVGIEIYESFDSILTINTGVITFPNLETEKKKGQHAILLVGYDDSTQKFIFQNSWGNNVGKNGFFDIDYKYILNEQLAFDFWTITFFDIDEIL